MGVPCQGRYSPKCGRAARPGTRAEICQEATPPKTAEFLSSIRDRLEEVRLQATRDAGPDDGRAGAALVGLRYNGTWLYCELRSVAQIAAASPNSA